MNEKQTLRVLCVLLLTLVVSAFGIKATAGDYPDEIMLDNMAVIFLTTQW